MNRCLGTAFLFAGVFFLGAGAGNAATAHGTVTNGTTGKPAADVEIILISLQGTMQPVANTKTDAQGQFSFDNPGIGAQPMLIRAVYKGVMFHEPLPPGRDAVSMDVYEPSQNPKTVSVTSHVVIFQPNGASLTVGEEYAVQNNNTPPIVFFRANGSFQMELPKGADLKQIAVAGPSGMPVIQAPIDDGKGKYSIAYAFQPGNTDVRLSYVLPYPNDTATIKLPTIYGGRLLVVAPPTVTLTGDGLQASGQEQGMNIYQRDSISAGTLVAVNLSGTAPPPTASNGNDSGDSGGQTQADSGQAGGTIQAVPGRLDTLKIPLILGFVGVFAIGAFLLARKPVAVTVAAGAAPVENSQPARKDARRASSQQNAAAPPTSTEGSGLASLDAVAGQSLDALKDMIFRLELRRQAGTISEEEYARERARVEKVLRDLVRG
ncbi:MAG TPA: hypothetical protein VLV88_13335 [Terriglobales bacterium]|nr:hypothetical protein [Terriglobales bacterium]